MLRRCFAKAARKTFSTFSMLNRSSVGCALLLTSKTVQRSSISAEIENEDWTLNISRYVLPPIGEDIPPLPVAVAAFKQALSECRAAEDHLRQVLTDGGWLA